MSVWVLVLLMAGGLYGWVMFSPVEVGGYGKSAVTQYIWNDGQLVLHSNGVEYMGSIATPCSIAPEHGAPRTVLVPAQKSEKWAVSKIVAIAPWFPGTAVVKCDDSVDVAQGTTGICVRIVRWEWFDYCAALLIIGPLVALSMRRQRREAQA